MTQEKGSYNKKSSHSQQNRPKHTPGNKNTQRTTHKKGTSENTDSSKTKKQPYNKPGKKSSSNYKSSSSRKGGGYSKYLGKSPSRGFKKKTVETVTDIKDDINRIEKEIELEIKTISNMKL